MSNYEAAMDILATSEAQHGQIVKEDWETATRLLFGDLAEKPVPVNTIVSIASDEGNPPNCITLIPVEGMGEFKWELYIPPTTEDAFEVVEDAEFNPLENPIQAPWGETYWSSLSSALTALSLALKGGQIKFNDGRVVQ